MSENVIIAVIGAIATVLGGSMGKIIELFKEWLNKRAENDPDFGCRVQLTFLKIAVGVLLVILIIVVLPSLSYITRIVLAVLCIGLGIMVALAFKRLRGQTQTLPTTWFLVLLSILAVVGGFLAVTGEPSLRAIVEPPEIWITKPAVGDSVTMEFSVEGGSKRIPQEDSIWVVIFNFRSGSFYPQNQPAQVRVNGGWSSISYFGEKEDLGAKFAVIVVLADKETQKIFNDYLTDARNKGGSPGLPQIPKSAKQYSNIEVLRSEE